MRRPEASTGLQPPRWSRCAIGADTAGRRFAAQWCAKSQKVLTSRPPAPGQWGARASHGRFPVRLFRTLLLGGAATALGATMALSATTAAPTAASREHAVAAHYTAAFLAEAQAAFIKDLRKPDVAMFPHGRPGVHAGSNASSLSSFNWAGYGDSSATHGEFTKVSGAWKVPAVTCTSEDRITAEWVGLDGLTSSTVEQDGTSSQCFQGKAIYYSWYEMYPAGSIAVGTTVAAGDNISASVARSGASYTLKLTDSTHTANSFSKAGSCATSTCVDTSAEWIVERPAYSIGIVPEAP